MPLSQDQIVARKRGVGGSEILAALGKDARCSRLELYKRKVGELPELDFSDDERVLFGNLLEPVIRQEFSRRIGAEVVIPEQTLFHPTAPLVGNPDGWMPELKAGVEIKTADKFLAAEFGDEETDQVPVRYLVQCAAYMALTDAHEWHLCVLIGGNDLRMYKIPRDQQIENAVLAGVSEFWKHVEERRPPEPETPEDIKLLWPKSVGRTVTAAESIATACTELSIVKAELKRLEASEEAFKGIIQKFMQDASDLTDESGKTLATWRSAKPSKKFDADKFKRDYPDLYATYEKETPGSRRFLLK